MMKKLKMINKDAIVGKQLDYTICHRVATIPNKVVRFSIVSLEIKGKNTIFVSDKGTELTLAKKYAEELLEKGELTLEHFSCWEILKIVDRDGKKR